MMISPTKIETVTKIMLKTPLVISSVDNAIFLINPYLFEISYKFKLLYILIFQFIYINFYLFYSVLIIYHEFHYH